MTKMHGQVLEIADLTVSYDRVPVLETIGMAIPDHGIYGLAGLNGQGKTTLIKTITGLKTPDSGTVRVFGAGRDDKDVRYNISYLPERFNPPPFLTGMEFLAFSCALFKAPFKKEEALAAAEELALSEEVLGRRIKTYSKGMRQKLGLISVLTSPAAFIVLDEPMSGLDPKARSLVKKMIEKARDEKKAVLICSHILVDLGGLCDQISILHGGQIVFEGSPEDLQKVGNSRDFEAAFLYIISEQKQVA